MTLQLGLLAPLRWKHDAAVASKCKQHLAVSRAGLGSLHVYISVVHHCEQRIVCPVLVHVIKASWLSIRLNASKLSLLLQWMLQWDTINAHTNNAKHRITQTARLSGPEVFPFLDTPCVYLKAQNTDIIMAKLSSCWKKRLIWCKTHLFYFFMKESCTHGWQDFCVF